MAEERQCMCTTPEITIKLNKQGPQGKVGPQGEPGFSPYVGVANDTPSQYILRITNEDGEYLTPNLKANIPLGGNTGEVLTKNSDVNGDCSFKALPYATTSQQGVVYLATTEEALLGDPDYAITGEVLLGVLANKIGNGTITLTQGGVTKGTFTTNQSGNTTIELDAGGGASYTAGNGIDITNDEISIDTNVVATQSDIPDVSNMVTTNTYQIISGSKEMTNLQVPYIYNQTGTQRIISSFGTSNVNFITDSITTTRSNVNYTILDSGNVGTYALTSSNISSDATITNLTSRISALEAKITALETNINGGNANA